MDNELEILYKVLDEIAVYLEQEHYDYFFDKFFTIPVDEIIPQTLNLVNQITRFSHKVCYHFFPQIDLIFHFCRLERNQLFVLWIFIGQL